MGSPARNVLSNLLHDLSKVCRQQQTLLCDTLENIATRWSSCSVIGRYISVLFRLNLESSSCMNLFLFYERAKLVKLSAIDLIVNMLQTQNQL